MARKRKRKPSWIEQQAASEALVRFGPEFSGLRELQRQAEQNYLMGVQQARGGARAIRQSVAQARPEFNAIYDRAGEAQARAASVYEDNVAALGSAADPVKAAIAGERALLSDQIEQSRAADMSSLKQRSLGAREGRVLAERQARSSYIDEIGKVLQRRQDLLGEQGAFTAATIGELLEEQRGRRHEIRKTRIQQRNQNRRTRMTQQGQDRRQVADLTQSERNSLRSAGVDPDTGKPLPNAKGKGRQLTPGQVGAAADTYGQALDWAKTMKARNRSRSEAAKVLTVGSDEITLKDPVTGRPQINPNGTPKVLPAIPQIKSQLLLSAALDMVYDGHVSRRNERLLKKRGIRLKDLGLVSYEEWVRRGNEPQARLAPYR